MQQATSTIYNQIREGNIAALARAITIVENELPGSRDLLLALKHHQAPRVVGITGPPGAGKSTMVNALLNHWVSQGRRIAVLAVDPSSPFNYGSILGDRIRMSDFYTNPNVFIRSLASRGALGGLSARIIEIADVVSEAPFDLVLVETVGVGQSEVEIAGLADCTVVTLVPEAGDEVQTLKAGILEIADVFVVNKADREGAETFYRNLRILAHEKADNGAEIPVLKTTAVSGSGVAAVAAAIDQVLAARVERPERHLQLLTEKCWQLIQARRMEGIDRTALKHDLAKALEQPGFNLYAFAGSRS